MKYLKPYNESVDINWEDIDDEELSVDIIYDEDFTNFLVDNNAYDEYLHAMKKVNGCNSVDEINNKLRGFLKTRVIDGSFGWSTTPQGHEYWENLHDKWKKLKFPPYGGRIVKLRDEESEYYKW